MWFAISTRATRVAELIGRAPRRVSFAAAARDDFAQLRSDELSRQEARDHRGSRLPARGVGPPV